MHACLRTPELLLNILEVASDETLAHLASTCRTFSQPALTILWRTMSSLWPLVRLLPEHATYKEDLSKIYPDADWSNYGGPITALRINTNAIQSQDFDRLLCYASRIKNFHFHKFDLEINNDDWLYHQMDEGFYDSLANANPNPGPLLPNVRELSIYVPLFIQSPVISRLVCGQSLKVLNFRELEESSRKAGWTDGDSDFFTEHLGEVIGKTSLSKLSIPMLDYYDRVLQMPEPHEFTISMPPQFYGLRTLNLQALALTGPSVARLGRMPGLKNLTMCLGDTLGEQLQLPPGCFSSLREVKVMARHRSSISSLVKQWDASGIESFTVERIGYWSSWDLTQLFYDLGRDLSRNITTLKVHSAPGHTLTSNPYNYRTSDLSFEALENLFCFNKLTCLSIGVGGRVTIDDSHLPKIAKNLPKLQDLHFDERENRAVPSLISPSGIYELVSSLADLRQLTMRFNATTNFPDENDVTPQKLVSFFVCESAATDSDAILAFLTRCFPCLKDLGWGWVYGDCGDVHEIEYEDEEAEQIGCISYKCWEIVSEHYPPKRHCE